MFHDDMKLILPSGTVGNVNGATQSLPPDCSSLCAQFVVEVAGGTPTVTFALQVSEDASNWVAAPILTDATDTVAASTSVQTATGVVRQFLDNPSGARKYRFYRAVTTANTNCTVRVEAYLTRATS